jgi:hypothetical protein
MSKNDLLVVPISINTILVCCWTGACCITAIRKPPFFVGYSYVWGIKSKEKKKTSRGQFLYWW